MREDGEIPEQLVEACKDNQTVKIIFASSLGSNYDVKTILDCVPLLEKAGLNFCIFIAGIGPLENFVKNSIRELSSKNIFYVGNPYSDELARIYSHCDIGISAYLPSSMVSLPIKAFHYTAAGLAIVNSLGGDFCQLLAESKSGIQYEAENSQSLAGAIKWYCENPQVLIDAKKASYNLGLNFDADLQYSKVSNLLKLLTIDKKLI